MDNNDVKLYIYIILLKQQWRCTPSNNAVELRKGPYVRAVTYIKIMVSLSKSFFFMI